jgi:hypothetical protein
MILCIGSPLNTFFETGNLLKVGLEDGSITLGYLDFGLLSTIPSQVRDALVCSVVLQVYSRDIGELLHRYLWTR